MMAILAENLQAVQHLANRETVNLKSEDGHTPLMMAAKTENKNIIDTLAKIDGIDITLRNNTGERAFDMFPYNKIQPYFWQ